MTPSVPARHLGRSVGDTCHLKAVMYSRRPGRTRMFNVLVGESSEPGHPAHAFFRRRYDTIVSRLSDTLQTAVGAGELLPNTDCAATAQELLAVMDGHQLQWALAPGSVDMARRLSVYLDRLYRSISTTGAHLPPKVLPD